MKYLLFNLVVSGALAYLILLAPDGSGFGGRGEVVAEIGRLGERAGPVAERTVLATCTNPAIIWRRAILPSAL